MPPLRRGLYAPSTGKLKGGMDLSLLCQSGTHPLPEIFFNAEVRAIPRGVQNVMIVVLSPRSLLLQVGLELRPSAPTYCGRAFPKLLDAYQLCMRTIVFFFYLQEVDPC